jgi:hypothetical protein
MQGGE